MTQLGFGVMLSMLSNHDDARKAYAAGLNKKIESVEIIENELRFTFEGGYKMAMFDDGQSCCETRYMSTDDDLLYFIGATLVDVEVASGPDMEGSDDAHETQFLKVITSKGEFTVVNHNEHNGYYGGFAIKTKIWE